MNELTKELFKNFGKISLLIIGGIMIGKSFYQINSFSAELLLGIGAGIAILGFYI